MLITNNSTDIILNKNMLTEIFYSGCKTEQKIGVESEKLLVYKSDGKAVKYEDVVIILNDFDEKIWQRLYENGKLIGLKSEIGTVSLEPGSQVEISLKPYKTLNDINLELMSFYTKLSVEADKIGANVLNCGNQTVSTFENINVIPKKRYECMTKYLPTKRLTPFVMMRETAGIQVNVDYKDENDAIRKLSLALKMSPFISSVYANSPVRNSKLTGYKSFRANSWLNVDEDRCGYVSEKLFLKNTDFSFRDYVEILLDVPMIFIQRGENCFPVSVTFRNFMDNGYNGIIPTIFDWYTHISLYFPDVRLKSYVEIRNHDAQNSAMTFSVPAFWKGIMYHNAAFEEIEKILSGFKYEDFMLLREQTPKNGLNTEFGKYKVYDFAKEFFDIAYAALKSNNENEENYLNEVFQYLSLRRVPADDIIEKYENMR